MKILKPEDPLEMQLFFAKAGEATIEEFFETMVTGKISVMLSEPPQTEGNRLLSDLRPLVLEMPPPIGPALVVFTRPERAHVLLDEYPEYRYTLEVDCPWVLQYAPAGIGLAVNVGWNVSVGVPPDKLHTLIANSNLLKRRDEPRAKRSWWQHLRGKG